MNLLPPWYYATRLLGVALIVAGILDDSSDRGTLIITGAGLLGLDKVASSAGSK
jgi:hypothetical protein